MQRWNQVYTFQEIGFTAEAVNGLHTREADVFAKWVCFNYMMREMPELHSGDVDQFEFAVDWLAHEVYVVEKDYTFEFA